MSAFLIQLFVALLKAFIPSISEASKNEYTVAVPEDDGLERRLRGSVEATWGKTVVFLCLSLALVGCGTRTVYVPYGTPMKIREKVMVKVWVRVKGGDDLETEIEVQEGWYVLPDKKKGMLSDT